MYLDKKTLLMIISVLVFTMTIAYALLSKNLNISGTTSIDSNFDIRITNIVKKAQNGTPTETNQPTYSSTNASFNVGFTTPGDSITYTITITNLGTLDGVLERIRLNCTDNEAIECTKSGLSRGDTIAKNGGTNTLDVTVTYNSSTTSQPSNTNSEITVSLNYQQNFNQVIVYNTYEIGDVIEYADSNWYVIKKSYDDEDYIMLLKETFLTAEQISNNYTYKNNGQEYNRMAYYRSLTCHMAGTFGNDTYDQQDTSGCGGHTNYSESDVKKVLDNYINDYLDSNELKEIDGYDIRLLTMDEYLDLKVIIPDAFKLDYYWTMSPRESFSVFGITGYGSSGSTYIFVPRGVRPVINLYKSAISNS